MHSKISFKLSLFIISGTGILFSSLIILSFNSHSSAMNSYAASSPINHNLFSQNSASSSPELIKASSSANLLGTVQKVPHVAAKAPGLVYETVLPVRLKIPSINIDAHIEHLGLAPDKKAM